MKHRVGGEGRAEDEELRCRSDQARGAGEVFRSQHLIAPHASPKPCSLRLQFYGFAKSRRSFSIAVFFPLNRPFCVTFITT